jgi:beta-1,4-N-acetylglucosaminyltransferase
MVLYIFIAICCIYRIYKSYSKTTKKFENINTLAILGSGGHTAEMLRFLEKIPVKYRPITLVAGICDGLSISKARNTAVLKESPIITIPRARKVGQSYVSSIFSTFRSFISAFTVVYRVNPDVVCNINFR